MRTNYPREETRQPQRVDTPKDRKYRALGTVLFFGSYLGFFLVLAVLAVRTPGYLLSDALMAIPGVSFVAGCIVLILHPKPKRVGRHKEAERKRLVENMPPLYLPRDESRES